MPFSCHFSRDHLVKRVQPHRRISIPESSPAETGWPVTPHTAGRAALLSCWEGTEKGKTQFILHTVNGVSETRGST